MACMPICMPSCMPIPSKPVECGHSLVRWSPPHVAQTHAAPPPRLPPSLAPCLPTLASSCSRSLSADVLGLRRSIAKLSPPPFLSGALSFTFTFSSFSFSSFNSASGGVFKLPLAPFAQVTSSRTNLRASCCCSSVPNILISLSVSPGLISSAFCTLMSQPVFSMISRTVSPPRPMTRPASRSRTHNFRGGGSSGAPSAGLPRG
mmetsp:Transcript_79708/g.203023  ORF Transcript_79708/g.203023 Transcript_79708/m.203023 type:complete len:204 (+) Transcript_79708:224-835(+)